jgi:hypothetical protein
MPDPDDLLPEQRGEAPSRADLASREVERRSPLGRPGRLRSWLTILATLAVLGVGVVVYLLAGRPDGY